MCVIRLYILTLLARSLASEATSSHTLEQCEVRFEDNGVCACSTHHGPLKCGQDNHSIEIQPCYCVYYDQHLNMTVVGHCAFSCFQNENSQIRITTSSAFNDNICNQYRLQFHRKGHFCGQCNDSYGLAVYSYKYLTCVPCQDYGYKNWLKYFAVALLPLTVFYILAVLMSFNVTSSSFNGLLFVVQALTSKQQLLIIEEIIHPKTFGAYFEKTVVSIVSITNLDFFSWLYTPFCLHPEATIFEVLSLDYIVALYPFLLIFMTYALVTAYDRQYRLLICMWKPFKVLTHRYRETWNIRTSLVEIFATFILLSSVKILDASFFILFSTPTHTATGRKLDYNLPLLDATIEYFGPQHLPFAVLAITVSLVFVLLPLLLLVTYPCGCFHRCLNRCGLTCQTLHVFMDAFQGSYRTHPRDMRYFSALYLLLRVLLLAQVQIFLTPLIYYSSGVLALVSAALVGVCQPYKVSSHNAIDSVLLTTMGVYLISFHEAHMLQLTGKGYYHQWNFVAGIQSIATGILVIYLVSLLAWKLLHRPTRAAIAKIKVMWQKCGHHCNKGAIEWLERVDNFSEANEDTPLLPQE